MFQELKKNMFTGRLSRSGFALGYVYYSLTLLVLVGIITATFAAINSIHPMGEGVFAGVVIIVGVFCIPYTLIFLYSLIARRAHDLDLSDKWVRNVYISYWDPKLNTSRLITEPGSPKKNGYGPPMESRNYFVIVGLRRPRKD